MRIEKYFLGFNFAFLFFCGRTTNVGFTANNMYPPKSQYVSYDKIRAIVSYSFTLEVKSKG